MAHDPNPLPKLSPSSDHENVPEVKERIDHIVGWIGAIERLRAESHPHTAGSIEVIRRAIRKTIIELLELYPEVEDLIPLLARKIEDDLILNLTEK